MTPKDRILQETAQTLESLDGIKRVEANPYLFTRIKARMQQQNSGWERTYSFISRPVIALAILIAVIAVNSFSVYKTDSENVSTDTDITAVSSDLNNEYMASADTYESQILNNQ
jgi:hypothetical protein